MDEFLDTLVDIFCRVFKLRDDALGLSFKGHIGQGERGREVGGEERFGFALCPGF